MKHNEPIQVQDIFSSEDLQMLLKRENRYQYIDTRNAVVLSLLVHQGLTSDEIINHKVKDIDLDRGTDYVKGTTNLNRRTLELVNRQMIVFSKYINVARPKLCVVIQINSF